jgi:hypothetical protein
VIRSSLPRRFDNRCNDGVMNNRAVEVSAWLLTVVIVLCTGAPAWCIVLHPDGEPNLAEWTDRPPENAVGLWGRGACCVAVSKDCVVTTRHQGGGVGTKVEIGGETYAVSRVWAHDVADLRIGELAGANLTEFVGLYQERAEVGLHAVISGYGMGRGEVLQTDGVTYGYGWDNSGERILRWGTNIIKRVRDGRELEDFISDVVTADFDGPGEGSSTTYEGICAARDSGGGWFVNVGGTWKLAALSRAVDTHYEQGHEGDPNYVLKEAWFRDRENPEAAQPDYFDGVRISSYAKWMMQTLPKPVTGDLNGDGRIDLGDFAAFCGLWGNTGCGPDDWCAGADFERDGDVDLGDLAEFGVHWLENVASN